MPGKIDFDRGVIIGKDQATGVNVYMYADTPGIYLNVQGLPVTTELAARAGFDIDKYYKARVKRERMAAAKAVIEQELDENNSKKKVIKERNGWAIVALGFGKHVIEDPDGQSVSERTLTGEEAQVVFDHLVPVSEEDGGEVEEAPEAPATKGKAAGKKIGRDPQ
jgi:hypothetical protein